MAWYKKSLTLWVLALIITLSAAYYQRVTGPTYPIKGKTEMNGEKLKYKLVTSNDSDKPAEITIEGAAKDLNAVVKFRKFKTKEEWQEAKFEKSEDKYIAKLPPQPPAGKLEYKVFVSAAGRELTLREEPVVIRFKGPVPMYILIPHILLMFTAMLYSTRTGIEGFWDSPKTKNMILITIVLLAIGGLILGPVVQKYAFGAFWTGWPFGHDLTDNKTFVAFAAWVIAYFRIRKNSNNRAWIIAAAVVLMLVYLIPHSMFGSELDYSTGEIGTGK